MDKVIISKKQFINIIENIKKQQEKVETFEKALGKICDGFIVYDSENLYLNSLIETLQLIFEDTREKKGSLTTLDWYLFEYSSKNEEKNIYYDGYIANINNADILYELLNSEIIGEGETYESNNIMFFRTFGRKLTEKEKKEYDAIPTIHI